MDGQPFYFKMPQIGGVKLIGELSDWVSAKDVILDPWAHLVRHCLES
jgi:aconitate hydratase